MAGKNGKIPSPDLSTESYDAAGRLGLELREDRSAEMQRRRWVVGLSMLGVTLAQLMALQQTGVVKRLPDLPLPGEDSNRVHEDAHAYKRLATPNAILQVISFGATAALAAMSGSDRARRQPWLPLALFAKTGYDSFIAVKQAQEAVGRKQRVSSYAAVSALSSFACLAIAAIDAATAGRGVAAEGARRYPQVRDAARERSSRLIERGSNVRDRAMAGGARLWERVPFRRENGVGDLGAR